jgi:DNA polymerase-3 subunit beta
MRFTCSRDQLLEGVLTVQKAISNRTTLPILEGILFDCRAGILKITATDLELGIECHVEASIMEGGWVVLDARLIADIIRKLPPADVDVFVDERNIARVECLNSCFEIQGQNGGDFPALATVDGEKSFKLPQDLLRSMIRQTVFACAVNETRPILTGALMEISGSRISMVALDGFRLAVRTVNTELSYGEFTAIIPAKTLNEIYKILKDHQDEIEINIAKNQALFEFNGIRIISRLLEGDFINYKQIIPDEYSTKIRVNTMDFLDSCERASLLAREGRNNLIKVSIKEDTMELSSNAEIGKVLEKVAIVTQGKDLDIAFNSKYLIDVLKVLESEQLEVEFTTNVSPCTIKPVDGEMYTYLLLPVRVIA